MKKSIIFIFLTILSISYINAQLVIDGEYRSRFQALHGYKVPVKANTDAIFGFDQRSRINLNFKSEKFDTRFSLQDARVWGSDDIYNATGIIGNSNAIDIFEAWFKVKIGGKSSLTLGRQQWNYNDMRITSTRNWGTTGMSYDGLLYQFKSGKITLDFGASYNADGAKNAEISTNIYADRIKMLNFINFNYQLNDNSYIAITASMAGKQDTSRTDIPLLVKGTHGLVFHLNQGKKATDGITAGLSAYYQHGTDMSRVADGSTYKQISAYLLSAELGFRAMNKKLEIIAGAELISGKDYSNTDADYNNVQHAFDMLYSTRFPYYGGNINYFLNQTSGKVGTKSGGFMDPFVKIGITPKPGRMFNLNVFMPMLSTNVTKEVDANGGNVYYDAALGTSFDVSYTHKFAPNIIFKIGGSYAMPSDTKVHMVYGSNPDMGKNYFCYTMLIINPKFFDNTPE
ncbi:MAG: alginate export family protein [Bacteroidales bacterium]|nr:alginate export family protein [Bacteroidales bacterium]